MSEVKVRYVAQIELDDHFDESQLCGVTVEDVERNMVDVQDGLTKALKIHLMEFVTLNGNVTVTPMYVNVRRVDDDMEGVSGTR